MKLRIEKPVVVITPSVNSPKLTRALQSVRDQTYKNIKHLIVADGANYTDDIIADNADLIQDGSFGIKLTSTPDNTGGAGFYGHRIYAAYPHLVDEDYVVFLDEDNWFDPNHVRTLVDTIESQDLAWAHSLRKVYLDDNTLLADDCCESIGRWPIFFTQDRDQKDYLVDTSTYCFRRDFLINVCQLWHSGWGGDRRFFKIIKDGAKYATTGLHTMNYILPDMNKAYGGDLKFFERGNEAVKQFYGGQYPWQTLDTTK